MAPTQAESKVGVEREMEDLRSQFRRIPDMEARTDQRFSLMEQPGPNDHAHTIPSPSTGEGSQSSSRSRHPPTTQDHHAERSSGAGLTTRDLELPVFAGTNPHAWLYRAKLYFSFHPLSYIEKISMAGVGFDDEALPWFRWIKCNNSFSSWSELH
ncbi:unnamed protein product [Spirodela intermedia]|uniref:Uncharacterized protein n=1 Tax=Spirodela intermedia TaxID=51605 RepID=A0A7I8JP51_SPIIN|nr:unnamed protein product [Spirodela intermedia]CAA6671343.1 unnamed protein product [Spirodela intermedia]